MATQPAPDPIPPGPGVDANGREVFDPTRNVLQLVEAAVERLDDLRRIEATHTREILDLRSSYFDHLREAEAEHQRDLRVGEEKLRVAEASRLDSIRQVDRDTVARSADVQAAQATTLAAQVARSAEDVRVTLAATVSPILEAIAALQRAQYETAGGKAQVVETSTSKRSEVGLMIAGVVGFFTVILGIAAVIVTIVLAR